MNDKKAIIGIFFLALIVRLGFFVAFAYHEDRTDFILGSTDTVAYMQIGENIFSDRGFSESFSAPFTPVAGRMPFTPFLLGLFQEKIFLYLLLQVFISAITVILVYQIAKIFFDGSIALWTGILVGLSPLLAFASINILTETWFSFWFFLGLYFLVKFIQEQSYGFIFLSAFFTGLATLTRSVTVLFPVLILFLILFLIKMPARKKVAGSFVFVLIFFAVLAPWVYRNYRVFGGVAVSSIPAYNLYFYNARVFLQEKEGLSSDQAKDIFRQKELEYRQNNPDVNEVTIQKFYKDEAMKVIRSDISGYVKFHLINTAAVYVNTGVNDIVSAWKGDTQDINISSYIYKGVPGIGELAKDHPVYFAGKMLVVLGYLVVFLGLFLTLGKYPFSRYYFWLMLVILFFGLTTGAVAEPRFRIPVEPLIILLFVQALSSVMGYANKDIEVKSKYEQ